MTHAQHIVIQLIAGAGTHPSQTSEEDIHEYAALANRICNVMGIPSASPVEQQVYVNGGHISPRGIV